MQDLPMKTNINWITISAALAGIFAYFCPGIPEAVRNDILLLLFAAVVVIVPLVHTFVNHPSNVATASAMVSRAASTGETIARRTASVFLAILFLTPMLALGGCAGSLTAGGLTLSPSAQTSIAKISALPLADLHNADAMALAQTPADTIADTCYKGLILLGSQQQASANTLAGSTVSGGFSLFQVARSAANNVNGAISPGQVKSLEVACAPLVIDTQTDVNVFLANLATLGKL